MNTGPGPDLGNETDTGSGTATQPEPIQTDASLPGGNRQRLKDGLGSLVTGIGQTASAAVGLATDAVVGGARAVVSFTSDAFRAGLEFVAGEPSTGEKTMSSKIIDLLPGIGASKRYAEAWRDYHLAKQAGNEQRMAEAKSMCIMALADGGVDILLLSGGPVGRVVRGAVGATLVARTARMLGAKDVDPIELAAKQIASSEKGGAVAEYLLERVEPTAAPQA